MQNDQNNDINIHQTNQITNELNSINNQLKQHVTQLFQEMEGYIENYCNQKYFLPQTINSEQIIKNEYHKGETVFDKLNETIERNDHVIDSYTNVETFLTIFSEKMKQLKESIYFQRNELAKNMKELIQNLTVIEVKRYNNLIKQTNNVETRKKMMMSMKNKVEKNLKTFQRKTVEEEQQENQQKKRYEEHCKDILSLEEFKQFEEWIDLSFETIIFDSQNEGIENIGNKTSSFLTNIMGKENLLFLIESEENDRFGCYVNKSIQQYDNPVEDYKGFLFLIHDEMIKLDVKQSTLITIHYHQKEDLFEIGKRNIIIKKGKENKSIYESLTSFDNDSAVELLPDDRKSFRVKRIIVFQFNESEEMKENKQRERIEKIEIEREELHDISEMNVKKHSKQLKEVCYHLEKKLSELIFDTSICNWNKHTTLLPELLISRKDILIVITNEIHEHIACYLNERIEGITSEIKTQKNHSKAIIYGYEDDSIAIHHCFDSIKFNLYHTNHEKLFSIGDNDIVIYKNHRKEESYCKTSTKFEHHWKQKTYFLSNESNSFSVERIQIYQLIDDKRHNKIDKNIDLETERKQMKLKELTNKLIENKSNEILQIEDCSCTEFKEVIFDSDWNDWSQFKSEFDGIASKKKQLVFLLETESNKKFGYYSQSLISINFRKIDSNAFLFTFKENKIDKYDIVCPDYSIIIYPSENEKLMTIGLNDIEIFKKNVFETCSYYSYYSFSFQQKGIKFDLLGNENNFIIKHIQIYQMQETKNTSILKTKRKKQFEYEQQKKYQNELIDLEKVTKEMKLKPIKELKQIEEWSHLFLNSVIFDSDCCDWSTKTSTFHKHLMNGRNILIYVETKNGYIFCLSVYRHETFYESNKFMFMEKVEKKIKEIQSYTHIVRIYSNDSHILFDKGYNFSVFKSNILFWPYFEETENDNNPIKINPKRILVFEMKETENDIPKELEIVENNYEKKEFNKIGKEIKIGRETRNLNSLTNEMKSNKIVELKQLEEWTILDFDSILFDSNICDWKSETSTFDSHLLYQNKIVLLIETYEGVKFGGYVEKQIHQTKRYINDDNIFLFTFKDNQPKKYDCIEGKGIFLMSSSKSDCLFSFLYEIYVNKSTIGKKSLCNENKPIDLQSFNFEDEENALIGKTEFIPKRIQVFKMKEKENITSKQRFKMFEERKNQKEKTKIENYQNQLKIQNIQRQKESKSLKLSTNVLKEEFPIEIQEIEEITKTRLKEVLFDSKCCDWSMNTLFIEKILNRKNLLFIIDIDNNLKIGTFIYEYHSLLSKPIIDAFIFSYKNDEMKIFESRTTDIPIVLSYDKKLFDIGDGDICIMKEENKNECSCEQNLFDLKGNINLLMDETKGKKAIFTPKRIQVIQFQQLELEKKRQKELKDKQYEKETQKLKEITDEVKQYQTDEINQLKKWSGMIFEEVLFDSNCCNWSIKHSTFNERIFGKKHLIFMIEDENRNKFGCYISSKIIKNNFFLNPSTSHPLSKVPSSNDIYSFLFSLHSNKRLENPMKFEITPKSEIHFVRLGTLYSDILFSIGNSDICVSKQDSNQNNKSIQSIHFDYKGKIYALTGSNQFKVKHIQVWQMKESEKLKQKRQKQIEEIEKKFKEEIDQLKELNDKLISNKSTELVKIEELSKSTFKQILFDSEICDWKISTSTFDKHIFNKDQLLFVIEKEDGQVFCFYLNEKVDKYYYSDENEWKRESIFDHYLEYFEIEKETKDFKTKHFQTKYNVSSDESNKQFNLYGRDTYNLFSLGIDIHITKQNTKENESNESQKFSSYQWQKGSFITPKRIQVYQMELNPSIKQNRINSQKEIEEKLNIKMKEEMKFLDENKMNILNDYHFDISVIENLCGMKSETILFDSLNCSTDIGFSTFKNHLKNKTNFIILYDDDKMKHGGFISSIDVETFLFYYDEKIQMKFGIERDKMKERNNDKSVFEIYENWNKKLFSIGNEDYCVEKTTKEKSDVGCYSLRNEYSLFNLDGFNVLQHPSLSFDKKRKRVIVIQMKEIINEFKEINSRKLKLNLIDNKQQKQNTFPKEMKQIELWTSFKTIEIVFDSSKDNWNKGTSIFDSKLIGNEKLVFYIETNMNNIIVGGFINTKINQIGKIEDSNCFIFTNKNNKLTKYSIQKDKSQNAFELYSQQDSKLFTFGNDLIVYKENMNEKSYVNERNGCFDYRKERNVLIGKIGTFSVKRIRIIQMK